MITAVHAAQSAIRSANAGAAAPVCTAPFVPSELSEPPELSSVEESSVALSFVEDEASPEGVVSVTAKLPRSATVKVAVPFSTLSGVTVTTSPSGLIAVRQMLLPLVGIDSFMPPAVHSSAGM